MADQPRRSSSLLDPEYADPEGPYLNPDHPRHAEALATQREIATVSQPRPEAPSAQRPPELSDIDTLPLGKPGEHVAAMLAQDAQAASTGQQAPAPSTHAATPPTASLPKVPWGGEGPEPTEEQQAAWAAAAQARTADRTALDHVIGVSEGLFGRQGNSTRALQALKDSDIGLMDLAYGVADIFSPAGDIQAIWDGAGQISRGFANWEPAEIASGTAELSGGVLGIFVPGSKQIRAGGKAAGKALKREPAQPAGANGNPPDGPPNGPIGDPRLKWNGIDILKLDSKQMQEFGRHHGVENLGGERPPVKYNYADQGTFEIPGGVEGTFSYWELLRLKASGIDASRIPKELHTEIQRKLARTMMPTNASDELIFNQYLFAMVTPNQPLAASQVITSVMRIRDPKDIERLAAKFEGEPGTPVSPEIRRKISNEIVEMYGLQARDKGGLGIRGTVDYSTLAEFAKAFQKDPKFFRRMEDKDGKEGWKEFNERVASRVNGLGTKTASLATGAQDPVNAAIGQVDRILARSEFKTLFKSDAAQRVFEGNVVDLWNQRVELRRAFDAKLKAGEIKAEAHKKAVKNLPKASAREVDDLSELLEQTGGSPFLDHRIKRLVEAVKMPRTIEGPNGPIPNPKIPSHLRNSDPNDPTQTLTLMSAHYDNALAARLREAKDNGLSGFAFSWAKWDRARGTLEPHEHWFPGLEKLPALSHEQMKEVVDTLRKSGRFSHARRPEDKHLGRLGRQKQPLPYEGPARAAALTLPPLLVAALAANRNRSAGGGDGESQQPDL